MAQPAPRRTDPRRPAARRPASVQPPPAATEEPVPLDPTAIHRAYRLHRARRHARLLHRRDSDRARVRFLAFMLVLIAACVFIGLTIRHEIQQLFGL